MKEYFSHDYNARNDNKLIKLKIFHKMTGLGVYWSLVEMLYEEGGKILLGDIVVIADELRTDVDIVKSVIKDFKLFEFDRKYFWCAGINRRLKLREEKSVKAKASISKRWHKDTENNDLQDTNVLRPLYETDTIKENKVNESKKYKENIERDTDPVAGKSTFILTVNTEKIYDLKKYSAENFQTACERAGMKLNGKYEERFSAFEDRVCGLSYPNVNEVVRYFNNFMNLPESKYQQEKLKKSNGKSTSTTIRTTSEAGKEFGRL